MKKNYASLYAALFIAGFLCFVHFTMMPQWVSHNTNLSEFSTPRAVEHLKKIADKPHYVGSQNHTVVANYLMSELRKLGLKPQWQEGTTLTEWGNLVKSKNIIAKIDGSDSSKALLLLSHYDSAPHSFSPGASDDGSGVATILEGVRAYLHQKKSPKNDLIILFSDAEELGLNGAALFVTQHQWAKNVGLVLNFEARGTTGPSYMLMEVNKGNAALVKGFTAANPKYPVSNSLMYSIYKMLPNDTDLTVFREQGKIQGFNFAFIDGHYNYHTQQDDFAHVNPTTIAHQGAYLMPLLSYFSNADLLDLNTTEDFVYFNTPFYFVSYPFDWVLPMCLGALLLFLFLIVLGIGKKILIPREIAKGFGRFLGALITIGALSYFGWQLLLKINPQYADIQQGFTYNGHAYIAAFVLFTLALGFLFYANVKSTNTVLNQFIAPLFLWIVINFGIAFYLPGAGFFILPVYFGLLMLAYFCITQKASLVVNVLFAIPALVIYVPFIFQFPIGLGLKLLVGSTTLTALTFGLLLPIFGLFTRKTLWAVVLFLISAGCLVWAQLNSNYEPGKAKPNSLLYVYNADKNQAIWATYDVTLDSWTHKYLGSHPKNADTTSQNPLFSKYNSAFTYSEIAPLKKLRRPTISFLRDSIVGTQRYLKIQIAPNRKVNRYDIFASIKMPIYNLKANGAKAIGQNGSLCQRKNERVLSYYVVDNEPLELEFSIPSKTKLDLNLMESSFDLLSNPLFSISPRATWMIPTPFVLNDAVVILQKIEASSKKTPKITSTIPIFDQRNDSIKTTVDSLKVKL